MAFEGKRLGQPDVSSKRNVAKESLRDPAKKGTMQKYREADIGTLHGYVQEAVVAATTNDPDTTPTEFYRNVVDALPNRIAKEAYETARQAISDGDPRGREVLTLLTLQSVLTVVDKHEPYYQDDIDDMVQESLVDVYNNTKTTTPRTAKVTTNVHLITSDAVRRHISNRDGIPAEWIKDGKDIDFNNRLETLLAENPAGLTNEKTLSVANQLAEDLQLPPKYAYGIVRSRDIFRASSTDSKRVRAFPPLNAPDIAQVEDAIDTNNALRSLLEKKNGITEREAEVVIRVFGLSQDLPETMDEIGNSMNGISHQRVAKLKDKVVDRIAKSGKLGYQPYSPPSA